MATVDELQIKVSADVSQLAQAGQQASTAIAKIDQEVKATNTDMAALRSVADTFIASIQRMTSASDSAATALAKIDGAAAKAGTSSQAAATSLESVGSASAKASASVGDIGHAAGDTEKALTKTSHASSAVTRELLVMTHEAMQGRFKNLAGSVLVMGEYLGGIPIPAMAAAGAIAAAGLYALHAAEQAAEATRAFRELEATMRLMGSGPASFGGLNGNSGQGATLEAHKYDKQVREKTASFAQKFNLSEGTGALWDSSDTGTKSATELLTVIERIPGASDTAKSKLAGLAAEWGRYNPSLGGDKGAAEAPVKAAEQLAKATESYKGMRDILLEIQAATPETLAALDKAEMAGNIQAARDTFIDAFGARLGTAGSAAATTANQRNIRGYRSTPGIEGSVADVTSLGPKADQNAVDAYERMPKAVEAARESLRALQADESKTNLQRAQAAAELTKTLTESVKANPVAFKQAMEMQDQATRELGRASNQAALQDRAEADRKANADTLDRRKVLEGELSAAKISAARTTGTAQVEEQNRVNDLTDQLGKLDTENFLQEQKKKIEGQKVGSAERRKLIQEEMQFIASSKYLGPQSEQYKSAQQDLANDQSRQDRRGAGGSALPSELGNDRQINADKLKQAQFELDAEVQAGRLTSAQKISVMRELTQASFAEDIARLQSEEAKLGEGTKAWKKAEEEKAKLRQELNTALAKLNDEAATDAKKAADKSAQAWASAIDPMVNSFTGALNKMISGTQSFGQSMAQAAGQWLLAEMDADIKAFAHHQLYSMLGLKEDETRSKGGIIYELMAQSQKTAATTTGTLARGSIEGAYQLRTAAMANQSLTVAQLTELAKTGATAAGAAERTGLQTAAAGATAAAETIPAKQSVAAHAASAAAAAYDATSQIWLVGPVLAPAAAAATYASVMVFGGMIPSFDVGAWDLPTDMIAQVHKGETILPASFAQDFRSVMGKASGDGTASQDSSGNQVHVHIQAVDAASFSARIKDHAREIAKHVAAVQSNNPSLRGS